MDGADDGAASVDGVAHCAHHDGGRPRVQATRRLVLHGSRIRSGLQACDAPHAALFYGKGWGRLVAQLEIWRRQQFLCLDMDPSHDANQGHTMLVCFAMNLKAAGQPSDIWCAACCIGQAVDTAEFLL